MAGAVVAEEAGPSVRFLRWCGMALVVASLLIVIATLLHPSRETAPTIIASEVGLIADMVFTRLPGCWYCLACPDSMCLSGAGWDGWAWQPSWLHFPTRI